MLVLTIGSHITCSKKGAIAKVAATVKVFEYEV
jgi:hypothetical protein